MSYIGAEPTTAAFPFDQFSGTGAATSFTLTYAPASATSILVAISGVTQNPNLYSVIGTTLSFSPAPPAGTNNISVLYLGLPVIGSSSPGNTAFMSSTDLTATAGQTVFASAGSYTPGFVQVYRNGARLGNADFTATNGTTITLASAATAGDLVTIEYYTLTSLVNALPLTGGTVTGSTTFDSTVTVNGAAVSGFTGMKNRIINGNMTIDQRNAGAAYTNSNQSLYGLDRWRSYGITSAVLTVQQSTTAPAGFSNSQSVTVTTSTTANDNGGLSQLIEGNNAFDLSWGTSSGVAVTASFWVRASVIGTYNIYLRYLGSTATYYYVATYTVNVANTWEQKSITISAPPVGAGAFTAALNSSYLEFRPVINSSGNTTTVTANTWSTTNAVKTAGSVDLASNSGATFYITGVQLERGSNATSFEFIDYGRQLAQCQRYCFVAVFNSNNYAGVSNTSSSGLASVPLPSPMRAAPTGTFPSGSYTADNGVVSLTFTSGNMIIDNSGVNVARVYFIGGTGGSFTGGQAFNTGSGTVILSAEL